jgi:periplasmic protein TonB
MDTSMGRFVLLSAALHLSVLAALSHDNVRPMLFPATLTVSLGAAPNTALSPPRRDGTSGSMHSARPQPPRNSPSQTPQSASPSKAAQKSTEIAEHPRTPLDNLDTPPSRNAEAAQENKAPVDAQQTDNTMQLSQLESLLRDAIAPYFTYPLMARRNGWQGQVQVGLRVEADGHLSHVRIAHSSGYRLLDSAALTALTQITTLPKAAGWLDGRHFDMVLPIEYRLIDGQS